MVELFANSGDPDQTPHFVASDLGQHCLPVTHFGVSRLQWVPADHFDLLPQQLKGPIDDPKVINAPLPTSFYVNK